MTTPNDELDDIPSLVPERDELASHRTNTRSTAAAARAAVPPQRGHVPAQATGTSGTVVFFLALLFLGMCASGAATYYFFEQNNQNKAALSEATSRIIALESTLNDMDAATKQSSMGLLDKVDTNFKEIDKLWAARNTLKTDLEKAQVALASVQKVAKELESGLGNNATQDNQRQQALTAAQAKLDDISKNFAGMGNLTQQLSSINTEVTRLKTQATKIEKDSESRLKAMEEDIESINVYRLQLNQSLNALQTKVNDLQQRVGQ